jgi:hypothetical protein
MPTSPDTAMQARKVTMSVGAWERIDKMGEIEGMSRDDVLEGAARRVDIQTVREGLGELLDMRLVGAGR